MRIYFKHSCDTWNQNRITQLSFVFINIDYAINYYFKYAGTRIGGNVNT